MRFEKGQRVRLPARLRVQGWVEVVMAQPTATGWHLVVADTARTLHEAELTEAELEQVEVVSADGAADSARVLAGFWTKWMRSATANAHATLLASSPLRPFAHQVNAVYGAMVPQPKLRFLLADEPGTGKTIMAGLYLREMQKLGFVHRALVVAPAGLVSKWQADFDRFFGGNLRRITNETVKQYALSTQHDMWIVSLELAATNPSVQEAIRPDRCGWDVVVFDEAHRLTPTAQTYYRAASMLSRGTPRVLLMTATPHRGSEWLFRHLMHLADPEVFPDPGSDPKRVLRRIAPGPIHFLRRMKEDLRDYDGKTPLFKNRHAANFRVPLNSIEDAFYREALDLVDQFFPMSAAPLARQVYGKRASSSLYALAETLRRRREGMGVLSPVQAAAEVDPYDEDPAAADEARVVAEVSRAAKAERRALDDLLARLDPLLDGELAVSKLPRLIEECLIANGIEPGNGQQAVVFSEFADTADWLVGRLQRAGFTARRYSGRDRQPVRDTIRAEFARQDFQIIVSTDAGNEGIDLQTAHVLVNWDIPWSLVRLEQRMGRIHRVGQRNPVELYNLIAVGTREGDVMHTLLDNFVNVANQLDGKIFDSLSLVAEMVDLDDDRLATLFAQTFIDGERRERAMRAVSAISAERIRSTAQRARRQEKDLASNVDVGEAVRLLHQDVLDRVNPAIVEAYLRRLAETGLVQIAKSAVGEGVLRVKASTALPGVLGPGVSALVATSREARVRANETGADASRAVALGPGEPAFGDLIGWVHGELASELFRGGLALDPSSVSDYELFAFEGELQQGVDLAGRRPSVPWAVLVRVDQTGARVVRWELLADLQPAEGGPATPHPASLIDAHACALRAAESESSDRAQDLLRWQAKAEGELRSLPSDLGREIDDRAQRIALRRNVEAMVRQRVELLRQMADVQIVDVRQTACLKVHANALPLEPTAADSEIIAMRLVREVLRSRDWQVADVSQERRGFDLLATRGRQQRAIEVKGVWESAASAGIQMTGNEVLIAAQHRREYVLWVVDQCHDGVGVTFGEYPDPVTTFKELMRHDAVFRVPGSALKAAREEVRQV
jgi:superfamily II DNA or RNA helicase